MCGIAGFYSDKFPQKEKSHLLRRMCDKIRHRGPDSDGYFVIDNFAISMRRLKIIDLETGDQPIFNEDETIAIVFNGEIYNFQELKERLQAKGHKFKTNTDTEVIIHLYEEEGYDCLQKLHGMFAFALLDIKQDKLFLARDRFGIKPLYYFFDNENFVFASELKAILQYPNIKKEINYSALNYYLTMESIPAPLSIFKNIYKLEQGHYLEFLNNQLNKQQYYFLDYQPKFTHKNIDFYTRELDWLIERAVERRQISDVPLGSFLSGGVDSSLIAAYIAAHSNTKLQTFSIGFEEKSFDESNYARQVADHLGTDHHEKIFTPKEMMQILPEIITSMDEPFADASILPTFLLSQFTKEHVTVALSGDGGDEVFAGYPTYLARKIAHYIPGFSYPLLRPFVKMLPASDENISFDFKAKRFVSGLKYAPDNRHQIWLGSFNFDEKLQLFSKVVRNRLGNEINCLKIIDDYRMKSTTENNWEKSLWLDMRFYLQDNMLVKVDRASMLNSLEVRVPFLDTEVVEFMARVPAKLKYKGFTSKFLLKELAKKYLPENIINRPKKGFGIPVAKWIKTDLKEEFVRTLVGKHIVDQQIFDPLYIQKLLQQHLSGRKDHRKLLWTLYMFQKWYGEYYD